MTLFLIPLMSFLARAAGADWIGHRVFKRPALAEWISGGCAGLVLVLALV